MARDSQSLQNLLMTLPGVKKVYFQPPSSIKLEYPCIIFKLAKIEPLHANDKKYLNMKRYLVTVVDPNPNTIIHEKVLELQLSSFDDHFVVDNLNHYICSLYY